MFNRKHPYLTFGAGILIAGAKFPFNWFFDDENGRGKKMRDTSFGLLYPHSDLQATWNNLESPGREAHDLTDLPVEWARLWDSYAVKFFCSFIVYGLTPSVLVNVYLLVRLFTG